MPAECSSVLPLFSFKEPHPFFGGVTFLESETAFAPRPDGRWVGRRSSRCLKAIIFVGTAFQGVISRYKAPEGVK